MYSNSSRVALLLIRLDLRLQVSRLVRLSHLLSPSLSNNNPRRITEEVVHLLERLLCSLGQQEPEEDGVGEVADDEGVVVFVPDIRHGDGRDLPDHGIEGKGRHSRDTDALGPSAGVEDFGGDDPGEWAAGGAEGEVVEPGHDDESPLCADIARHAGWILGEENCSDNEGYHVTEIAEDERAPAAELVDQQHAKELRNQGDNAIDGLVFQGIVSRNALHHRFSHGISSTRVWRLTILP